MRTSKKIQKWLFSDLREVEQDFKVRHFRISLLVGIACYITWTGFTFLFEEQIGDPLREWCLISSLAFLSVFTVSFFSEWAKANIENLILIPFLAVIGHCINALIANPDVFGYWISNFMAFSICSILLLKRSSIISYAVMVLVCFLSLPFFKIVPFDTSLIFFSISVIIHSLAVICIIPQDIWSIKILKEKNRKIQNLSNEQSIMVAQISHDLKTPLVSLVALMPKLKDMITDPKGKKMLDVMLNSTSYIQSLTSQITTFHKVISGDVKPKFEEVKLSDIAQSCIDISYTASASRQPTITNVIPNEIYIYADRLLIEQVLINLIANSLKYNSNDKPEVIINGDIINNSIKISVRDNGDGMTQKESKKAFELFYRADLSRSDLSSMGMGLSICKEILRIHNSKIKIAYTSPSEGTCIEFHLPLAHKTLKEKVA